MSGSNSRLAGVIVLTINGSIFNVVGDAEYQAVTVLRETLKGQSTVEGFSEMPLECYFAANLRDSGTVSVASLGALTSATIIAQLANGKTLYGTPMWQVGEIGVKTQDGTFPIRFEGPSLIESTV
jgi:hypothetical protein